MRFNRAIAYCHHCGQEHVATQTEVWHAYQITDLNLPFRNSHGLHFWAPNDGDPHTVVDWMRRYFPDHVHRIRQPLEPDRNAPILML